jgi:xanthine dehydrogenase molybdenum-binding subunit
MSETFLNIGTDTRRKDGVSRVTGAEQYTCDLFLPGMWHAVTLRSPYPHADILSVDAREAEAMGAVVLTADDVPDAWYNERGVSVPDKTFRDRRVLPRKARQVGEAIVAVAAPTEELAFKALRALKVEYKILPPVLDAEEGMKSGSAALYDFIYFGREKVEIRSNIACEREIHVGEAQAAFPRSDYVFEETFQLQRVYHHQMDTKSALVKPEPDGGITVWCTTQSIHNVRIQLGRIFGIPLSKVNVKKTALGGSFGSSIQMNSIIPIVTALALKTKRPVKLVSSREDDLYDHTKFPGRIRLKVGVNKDMELQAAECEVLEDIGSHQIQAYSLLGSLAGWLVSLYKWKNLDYWAKAVYTNKVPACAMQGYGNPQMNFAVESMMEIISERCGFDPIAFRLKNYVGAGDEFWGQGPTVRSIIKTCGVEESLRVGAERIGWDKRGQAAEKTGRYRRGIGLGRGFHTSGAGAPQPAEVIDYSSATVKINEDGSIDLMHPLMDLGGGTNDAHAKIVAEALQVPLALVNLSPVDTRTTSFDVCTHASRGIYVGGAAALQAALEVKAQLLDFAGRLLNEFPDHLELVYDREAGQTFVQTKEVQIKRVTLGEVAKMGWINGWGTLAATGSLRQKNCPPSFVTNFVEVEVDTWTGVVKIVRAISLADCGTPINPGLAAGQLEGSLARYGGYALTEATENRLDSGNLICDGFITDNKTFTTCEMPHLPDLETYFAHTHEPSGPFGAKGLGEAAGNSVASAIANAMANAIGVHFTSLPITPERVLAALATKEAK